MVVSIVFILMILVPNMKPLSAEDLAEIQRNFPMELKITKVQTILERSLSILMGIFPENVIEVMAKNDLIAVITTGVVIGVLINDTDENPSVIIKYVHLVLLPLIDIQICTRA